MKDEFRYETAFSRNIGWLTRAEQEALRHKRVAIAGMGGVGGRHLLTLTRLGVGAFHLADFDNFELANFNRQAGAGVSSLGRPKLEVLAELARDINPRLKLRLFAEGVTSGNLADFLADVDIYLDGLDFFALEIRRAVFAACARLGIPAITAAPLGMGAALLNFLPGRMTFEEYFRLEGQPPEEQLLRFLLGLSPAMLQRRYLVEPSAVDLAAHRGPSTPMACELCAGLAATHTLNILLGRGNVPAAPQGVHFDAYRDRLVRTWRPWGNRNPIQRLGLAVARRQIARMRRAMSAAAAEQPAPATPLARILELARWAPSGDNTQPWRFEIKDDRRLVVHGRDTRERCVYDLRGRASQIAIGALLENISIAAGTFGLRPTFVRRLASDETQPTFDVEFSAAPEIAADPLAPYIPIRATQRRALATRPLTTREREALSGALGAQFQVLWLDGIGNRMRAARVLFRSAGIRLTIPEAYAVHREVIQWRSRYSAERIPDEAVGLDPLATRLMCWTLQSWRRVLFFNRYLAGTLLPRIELDVVPGLACAAHFVISAARRPESIDDYVAAGRAVQRFWLTAAKLGLQLQPEMTPLIFSGYADDGVRFTASAAGNARAARLSRALGRLIGDDHKRRAVFMGRIGAGPLPRARSTRLPLARLLVTPEAEYMRREA